MSENRSYYCVGCYWHGGNPEDQFPRFKEQGIWENGFDDKYIEAVKRVAVGSRIAAKTSYTRKKDDRTISVLEVHGIGTVTANPGNGKTLNVNWDNDFKSFKIDGAGAYRSTINRVNNDKNRRLIFEHGNSNDAAILELEPMDVKLPLNQIMYGPPGTGKTYHTINEALRICDPRFYYDNVDDRAELLRRFKELLIDEEKGKDGRIAFCTFHQSMSYEDFIEGIKPLMNDGDSSLKYEIKSGLFKDMAERAAYHTSENVDEDRQRLSFTDEEYAKAQFYKLSLGNSTIEEDTEIYRYCMDNGVISIGFMQGSDLTGKSQGDIKQMVADVRDTPYAATAMNYFIHYLKTGHYVVVTNGNVRVRAIGRVTGEYFHADQGIEYPHFRKVDWLLKDVDIPYQEIYSRQFSQQSIYKLDSDGINRDFFVKQPRKSDALGKNFVLIIDEINRGNVSQIFGELITLIEDTKRADKPEALSSILPYSRKMFSVPDNLYLIGTMNTADRSVEALDTALRRRFTFKEMNPKPELLTGTQVLFRLLWERAEIAWESEPYLSEENGLIDLLGIDRTLWEKEKRVLWERWLKTGQLEEQADELRPFFGQSPDANLLHDILKTINGRIVQLLDRDHLIGHTYLMGVYSWTDLLLAFKDKIIPLLQEYFYGNYANMRRVLGSGFVTDGASKNYSLIGFDGDEEGDEVEGKKVFELVPFEAQGDEELFKSAVMALLARS